MLTSINLNEILTTGQQMKTKLNAKNPWKLAEKKAKDSKNIKIKTIRSGWIKIRRLEWFWLWRGAEESNKSVKNIKHRKNKKIYFLEK